MSGLEQAVQPILKPMMLGQPKLLDEPAIHGLATWATKTALVFELVQQDGDTTASAADRQWFREHCQPLPNSRIWVARYAGTLGPVLLARSTLLTYDMPAAAPVPSPHGLVVVLAYGQVALRVAMVRSAPILPTRFAVTEQPNTPVVWPGGGPLAWPPEIALDDQVLQGFRAVHLPTDGPGALKRYGPPSRS